MLVFFKCLVYLVCIVEKRLVKNRGEVCFFFVFLFDGFLCCVLRLNECLEEVILFFVNFIDVNLIFLSILFICFFFLVILYNCCNFIEVSLLFIEIFVNN